MSSTAAPRDPNYVPAALFAKSSAPTEVEPGQINSSTGRILVDAASGSGTVTSVSVVTANGFAGSVANPTTTPAITLTTTVTGILKGDGTAISAATAGTDYTALAFKTYSVSGQSDIVADSASDTFTFAAGSNITLTTNAGTDTLTIAASGGSSGITIGTTTITSGTNTRILYDNSGVVGEYTLTGSGTVVVMQNTPTITSPVISTGLTASGSAANDFSASTGTFLTSSGANTLSGATTIADATTPSLTTAAGKTNTGFVQVNGKTSGALKITAADATAQTITLTTAAQTVGAATLTIPNMANTNKTIAWLESPSFTTPSLGVATATSLAIGGATIGSNGLAITGHVLVEGVTSTGATGTGKFVFDGTPTLVTPVLGVATATSINGLTITSSTGTLTITNAKTLSVAKSLTLDGTDSTTMTFPSTSATIARTDAAQTFTGTQTFSQVITTNNAITASGNAATVPVTSKINTVTNNSAATLTITMTTTSAVDRQPSIVCILDASAVAQTITWVNTENSTVSAPTTSNGSTTLPLTVGFMYNNATSKWRCVASA